MLLMRPGWIASLRERHHLPAITHKKEFLAVALCFCSVNPLLRSVPKNRCSGSKPEGSRAHLCQLPQYWLMHLVSLLASRAQGGSALGVLQPDLVMPIVVRSIGGGLQHSGDPSAARRFMTDEDLKLLAHSASTPESFRPPPHCRQPALGAQQACAFPRPIVKPNDAITWVNISIVALLHVADYATQVSRGLTWSTDGASRSASLTRVAVAAFYRAEPGCCQLKIALRGNLLAYLYTELWAKSSFSSQLPHDKKLMSMVRAWTEEADAFGTQSLKS
eukprot:6188543-Pleurochrysis_carterae.AAC.6